MTDPVIAPLGDAALTVSLGDGIDEALSRSVVMNAQAISGAAIMGVTDVVPAYASLAVFYDPVIIGYDDVRQRVLAALAAPDAGPLSGGEGSVIHRIPVVYDGEDLDDVARRTGFSRNEVIAMHSAIEYRVFVTGFIPGFAYLGILDERLSVPRREVPRRRVPPGSVAIAERQTGVYPAASPGGWHLIGTTSVTMFDPMRHRPALLSVGDRVRFEPLE